MGELKLVAAACALPDRGALGITGSPGVSVSVVDPPLGASDSIGRENFSGFPLACENSIVVFYSITEWFETF